MKINTIMAGMMLGLFVVPGLISVAGVTKGLPTIVSDNAKDAQGTHRALLVGIDQYDPAYNPGPPCLVASMMPRAGGTPVVGNFDKDGKADPAAVGTDGYWTMWLSGSEYAPVRSMIPLIP